MAKSVKIQIDGMDRLKKKLNAMDQNVGQVLADSLAQGAQIGADAANGMAPESGAVGVDILNRSVKHATVGVGIDKKKWYLRFLETGTVAHAIKVTNASALVFEGDIGTVIIKAVQHTGLMAKPFLRPGIDENISRIVDEVGKAIKERAGLP